MIKPTLVYNNILIGGYNNDNIIYIFTIFFGPGRAGPEDKIDGPDWAENLQPLQVSSRYVQQSWSGTTFIWGAIPIGMQFWM